MIIRMIAEKPAIAGVLTNSPQLAINFLITFLTLLFSPDAPPRMIGQ
ncbi:hypothetical protein [Massilia sp. TS11]|nr:hypothetical protein [Massilia sp. TS11]MCG2583920.1 hypothetical protein [Massilia sp. TS11]